MLVAAAAGKGQFYRYFQSKDELIAAVVRHQLDEHLDWQRGALEQIDSWAELDRYLTELVTAHGERGLVGGCPVGSLALELADRDERLRRELAAALDEWKASLATGLRRLAARGRLRDDASPERLAAATLATIQGAYLLATVHRDADVMAQALEAALAYLRSYASIPGSQEAERGTV